MIPTAVALLPILIILWYLRTRYVMATVRGNSMVPTFHDGQRILVRRTGRRELRRGDIVVFATPATDADGRAGLSGAGAGSPAWLVKRIAAVAGDSVPPELLALYGDDELVPPGHCVVRGDNPHSLDSRHFGYLPERSVLGVVRSPRR